ncbi:MAG: 30S ribosomal protein S5 [archaeon]|nr:30S ribosomal protein S5 [archaeon]
MAAKETKNEPKDVIEPVPEELSKIGDIHEKVAEIVAEIVGGEVPRFPKRKSRKEMQEEKERSALINWIPKTAIGKLVKEGKEKDFDHILTMHKTILEPQIADTLLNLENDLLLIGQAKGKFGGGKRRAWRQTQRKTMEGNVATFSCMAVVGDKKGHVGLGYGKSKETLPSREKALRKAKLNMIKITIGYETPGDSGEPHTVPFIVEGKCGSVRMKLIPAPRGTGLVVGDEAKKILWLAGIKDVYGVTKGQTRTTFNVAKACIDALNKTGRMKL